MTATGFGLLWFFIYGSYALAFWYGVKLILDGNPTYNPGNMVTVGIFYMVTDLVVILQFSGVFFCYDRQHEFWNFFAIY